MSSRMPPRLRPTPSTEPVGSLTPRLELRPDTESIDPAVWVGGEATAAIRRLTIADVAELRRAIRIMRRLIGGTLPIIKGTDATDAVGRPVDPLDDSASGFCLTGAFMRVSRPNPNVFSTWTRLGHAAAKDLLGDSEADLFSYNDNPAVGRDQLLALLEEIEARLDRLQQQRGSIGRD